jgi:hypothetical protein
MYFEMQKCNLADIKLLKLDQSLWHKRVDLDKVDIGTNNIDAVQEEYLSDDAKDLVEQ